MKPNLDSAAAMVAVNCVACATRFECGARAGSCWCQELDAVPAETLRKDVPGNSNSAPAGCYCPACLNALLAGSREPDVAPNARLGETAAQ